MIRPTKEVRQEVYKELLEEFKQEILEKEEEINCLQKKRIKQDILNRHRIGSEDNKEFEKSQNEFYQKEKTLKEEIRGIDRKIEVLEENEEQYIG